MRKVSSALFGAILTAAMTLPALAAPSAPARLIDAATVPSLTPGHAHVAPVADPFKHKIGWTVLPSTPDSMRWTAMANDSKIIYTTGGVNASSQFSTLMYAYNPLTKKWSSFSMPTPSVYNAMAYDGKGHLVLSVGYNGGGSFGPGVYYVYTVATKKWSAPISDSSGKYMLWNSAGSDGQGHVYFTRGAEGTNSSTGQLAFSKDFVMYDTATGKFKSLANLPVAETGTTLDYDENGHFFLMGGATLDSTGTTILWNNANVYEYTIATNKWKLVATYTDSTGDNASAFIKKQGKIYLTQGVTNHGISSPWSTNALSFDVTTDKFATIASTPGISGWNGGVFLYNQFFCNQGLDGSTSNTGFWAYRPAK